MGVAENKALIRRLNAEVINGGRTDILDEFYAPDLVHKRRGLEYIASSYKGHEGFSGGLHHLRDAFLNYHSQIEDQVGEGDTVITRYTISGTHKGELFGIPPTGKTISMVQIVYFRFNAEGKIGEIWAINDELGFLLQSGLVDMQQVREKK